jgi:hypothetical protein
MYDPTETYFVGKFAEVNTGVTYSNHQCGKGKTGKSEGEVVQYNKLSPCQELKPGPLDRPESAARQKGLQATIRVLMHV